VNEQKPSPDLDKECSHKFASFKPGLCICEICHQVRPAADESVKQVVTDELVRKAKLFDEAVAKKVIPPIFLNGETKRDPVLREALQQDGRNRDCKQHDFVPYYEGAEICTYCKTVRSEPATVASKEAVTPSDEQDGRRYRFLCEHPDWRYIEDICQRIIAKSAIEFYAALSAEIDKRMKMGGNRGKKRLPNGSLAFPDVAQRDASKGEPTS
jgi:hypothetical protein